MRQTVQNTDSVPAENHFSRLARYNTKQNQCFSRDYGYVLSLNHFDRVSRIPGNNNLACNEKAFVIGELQAKLDIDTIAAAATTQEEAAEIYTASLLVIDVDTAAERGYLTMLAARLNLDDSLIAHIHQSIASATAPRE